MARVYSKLHWTTGLVLVLVGLIFTRQTIVWATGSSSNYRIDESFIGPGGNLDSGSTNFSLESGQQSLGNAGVAQGTSTNYRVQSGYTTTADPRLTCIITSSSINFGGFSTSTAKTGTATFSVLNYTAYGYNVSIIGNTPSNGSHNLTGINPTDISRPSTEQFGINLVANTSPATYGADPVQVPDNTFSFGVAATNYNATNNYRYVAGETIASAPQSSGQTDFTISYLINVATTTPGGSYSGNQTIVCTGTY